MQSELDRKNSIVYHRVKSGDKTITVIDKRMQRLIKELTFMNQRRFKLHKSF